MNHPFPYIRESLDELKQRLGLEKKARRYKRIHLLYLIKSGLVRTRLDAADFLAIDRETVRVWLGKYEEGGLEELLLIRTHSNRRSAIPSDALAALKKN